MIVPQFIRFYGYTNNQTMNEFAVTFFSLVNSMFRLKADEKLERITILRVSMSEDISSTIKELEKSSKGLSGILEEAETVQRIKK